MKKLKLLIVDDDQSQTQSLIDSIKEKNIELAKEGLEIVHTISMTKETALENLSKGNYDFAIVDLKLSDDKTKTEGNEIIKNIKENLRFPVVVLSNYPENMDPEFSIESDLFLIKERTATKYSDLLTEIHSLYKTGITTLFSEDGFLLTHINKTLLELFWVRMASDWKYIVGKIEDPYIRERVIAKQLTNLLKEDMQLDNLISEKSEPFEMFLIPPIRKDYYTGDIISKDDLHYLIISPACDMEIRKDSKPKIENVVLSRLWPLKDHFITKECWSDNKFQDSKKNKITDIIRFKLSGYHLLPPVKEKMGFIIDFADIQSIPYSELANFKRVASITEPYLKNILSRFSNHFNRLGQPDFKEENLLEEIKSL